jgi:hypothetical protein
VLVLALFLLLAQGVEKPQVVEPALQKLRSFLVQIDEDPNVDLDGPIKRLRQVRVPGANAALLAICLRSSAMPWVQGQHVIAWARLPSTTAALPRVRDGLVHMLGWLICVSYVAALQAFFKEAYKNRVRKQQDGGASDERAYSGRAGRGGQKPDGWLENLCQVRGRQ